jgi:hypothetical protein
MKLRLVRFIGVFYLFYLVMEVLRKPLLNPEFADRLFIEPVDIALGLLLASILFLAYSLFTYLYLFYSYERLSKWIHIFAILFIAFAVIGMRYLVDEVIIKAITGYGNYYEGTTAAYYIADNLYYAFLYTLFGVMWFFYRFVQYRERQQQELLLENKKTELSFLRSQVNPHFLFNMLNNIYSLITMQSPKALTATDKLSKLLRYSLYESDSTVTIEQEFGSVEDFVDLQRLRFRESVQIKIHYDDDISQKQIAPFILLPLIENSFKHGEVTDPDQPISVNCIQENENLILTVQNKIAQRNKDSVGGIGVENLKKRLQLIYGNEHSFEQSVHDGIFKTVIKLNI